MFMGDLGHGPYRAPSWSWAAVDCAVTTQLTTSVGGLGARIPHNHDFQVLRWEITPANDASPLAQVSDAFLEVEGHCGSVSCLANDVVTDIPGEMKSAPATVQGWQHWNLAEHYFDDPGRAQQLGAFVLVQLAAWTKEDWRFAADGSEVEVRTPYVAYLLLEPIEGRESSYRRVGIALAKGWSDEDYGWEARKLVIF